MKKATLADVLYHAKRIEGAPADLDDYVWLDLSEHDGEPVETPHATMADHNRSVHIPFTHERVSTYGTMAFGWDVKTRRGVWRSAPPDGDE